MEWVACNGQKVTPGEYSWEPRLIEKDNLVRCSGFYFVDRVWCTKGGGRLWGEGDECDCCGSTGRSECNELPLEVDTNPDKSPIKIEIIEIEGRVAKSGQSGRLKTCWPQGHRRFKSGLGHNKKVDK